MDRATDRQALEAMFERAGVRYRTKANSGPDYVIDEVDVEVHSAGRTGPNVGYAGFYACFTFDADGNLKAVGAWE